jgi:hypothetical protein
MNHTFRRNDVVIEKKYGGSFGRVWRVLTPEHLLVVTAGKHIAIYHPDDIELSDYKGYWDCGYSDLRRRFPVFRQMPSLHMLKKRARWYNPDIFASARRDGRLPRHTHGRGRYGGQKKEYMGRPD